MNFKTIWQSFAGTSPLPWWHVLILLVTLSEGTVEQPFKFLLIVSALAGLISSEKEAQKWVFTGHVIGLAGSLWVGGYMAANHFYLLFYFTCFLMARAFGWIEDRAYGNYLLIVLMLFAGIQKLLSPFYMEGSYLSFLYLKGKCELVNTFLFPDWTSLVASYQKVYAMSKDMLPGEVLPFSGTLPPFFFEYTLLMSYTIIAVELFFIWVFVYFHPAKRGWLILTFVWLTFLFLREHAFFCLLCILALFNCPEDAARLRNSLKWTVVVLILLKTFLPNEVW